MQNALDAHAPFTDLDDLDCFVSQAGNLQVSCPITINIRFLELCFDGECGNVGDTDIDAGFEVIGLGCPGMRVRRRRGCSLQCLSALV